jgi:hypothetical protein
MGTDTDLTEAVTSRWYQTLDTDSLHRDTGLDAMLDQMFQYQ